MHAIPFQDGPRRRGGERRVVTVVFCDLVDSSGLAGSLEDEVWNDIVSKYYCACDKVVERFDGHPDEDAGDGLLYYFGLPNAHEDDAYRAVRAGIEVIDAIARLKSELGIELHVRVGIDTGGVIVSELARGKKGEHTTGSPLHIAARLQSIARPDTVLVSDATFKLVQDDFTYEDLGSHHLRNVVNAVHVYRMVAEADPADRRDESGGRRLTPMIGRESERGALLELWQRAQSGRCLTVAIEGEAGIGKSRLVKAMTECVANRIMFRCSQINCGSALFPVIKGLERSLGFDQTDDSAQKFQILEDRLEQLGFPGHETAALLAAEFSLPLPDDHSVAPSSGQKRRQQTLHLLIDWFFRAAEQQPVMAVWEDLHWADPSTIELLGLVIERATTTPLLNIITFRPHFECPWAEFPSLTTLQLARLERRDVEEMIVKIAGGRSLPSHIVGQIVEKSDGLPLFVEELLRTVLDTGFVPEEGHDTSTGQTSISIPAKLSGWLMSRLDRLGPAKEIAQCGAVFGRTFSEDLMRAVLLARAGRTEEDPEIAQRAQDSLSQLVDAGVLHRRRARQTTYEFKHALIQLAAYESLLKRDRPSYHLLTAQVLEKQFPQVVETEPELLAHHYTEAANVEKALDYWQKAGERSRDRSANKEAVHHFDRALKVAATVADSERRENREWTLRVASLTPLIAAEGYVADKLSEAVDRALALSRKLGKDPFAVRYVQWVTRLVRGNYPEALRLSEEFLDDAKQQPNVTPLLMGHRLRGFSQFGVGELSAAQGHLQQALDLYDPALHGELKNQGYGQDPRCACEAFMGLVRWLRSDRDGSASWIHQALEHAKEANHSNTWGYVLCWAVVWDVFRRDVKVAERRAAELMAFSEKEYLPVWLSYSSVLHGWALAQLGDTENGLTQMKLGLADFDYPSSEQAKLLLGRKPHGMGFMKTFLMCLLAEACGVAGRPAEGLAILDSVLSIVEQSRESFWKAEAQRLRGELVLEAEPPSDVADQAARGCFESARATASRQGANMLEPRVAASLERLSRRLASGRGD